MTDNSLLEDFTDEAREHLEALEGCLLQLMSDPTNRELLDTIFRSMHTIKGASAYLGLDHIARLTHRLEHLLDLFRDGRLLVDKVAVDLLIDAGDRIGDLIAQVEQSGRESTDIDDLLDRVAIIANGSTPTDSEAQTTTRYDGEADTELFDIFMEQLAAGIGELMETSRRLARGERVTQAAVEMADQVDRLAATANYMGYDALSAVYDDMRAAIETFSSRSEAARAVDIDELLQTAVVSGMAASKVSLPPPTLSKRSMPGSWFKWRTMNPSPLTAKTCQAMQPTGLVRYRPTTPTGISISLGIWMMTWIPNRKKPHRKHPSRRG